MVVVEKPFRNLDASPVLSGIEKECFFVQFCPPWVVGSQGTKRIKEEKETHLDVFYIFARSLAGLLFCIM